MTWVVPPALVRESVDRGSVAIITGDLNDELFERALRTPVLGWDLETSGLEWADEIATVQLQLDAMTLVIRPGRSVPHRLKALLEDPGVLKVMHHAMFDLRFMAYHWDAGPANVACTKIASKLAWPDAPAEEHSLAALVARHFGVKLDKSQRTTDWTADDLDPAQLHYAADDVRYLWPLYEQLDGELKRRDLVSLRQRCYAHLATRVQLDLLGYDDVFRY
jgi:ribonuclease D